MRRLKQKNMNFYARYQEKPRQTERQTRHWGRIGLLTGVVVFGLLTGLFFFSREQLDNAKREKLSLLRQTKNETILQEIEASAELAEKIAMHEQLLAAQKMDINTLREARESSNSLPAGLLQRVLDCGGNGVVITEISFVDGCLSVAAVVQQPEQVSTFITRLKELHVFASVDYDGYTGEAGAYAFTAITRF